MRNGKAVINLQTGAHLPCCWDICEKDGVELHKTRVRSGVESVTYVFCSDRHRMYWVNSHRDNGNLPAGYRSTML